MVEIPELIEMEKKVVSKGGKQSLSVGHSIKGKKVTYDVSAREPSSAMAQLK